MDKWFHIPALSNISVIIIFWYTYYCYYTFTEWIF